MSVCVNGSITKDFKVEKGLRQGDPLSPFLFVLASEVLSALMRKAISIGEFRGFKINEEVEVSMLQFADDTVIISDGVFSNLWSIKEILRGFELMSGLRVNFNKSSLYGVHVKEGFLETASSFLACKVDKLPFKFLGVKVGGNPRRIDFWKDLILMLKRRLALWKGIHLNLAGRVCLINSVLNAIPIYSLSFYKAPSKVIMEIRSIQSKFLWNISDAKRSVHWVAWDKVCKPKEEGGLGVKNVEILNVALLSKWKWRILVEEEAVWRDILCARYGNIKMKVLIGDVSVVSNRDSIWWRDILISDNYALLLKHNFAGAVLCRLGTGSDIPFWYGVWAGKQPLSFDYPELFVTALDDAISVQQAGTFVESVWCWNTDAFLGAGNTSQTENWKELFSSFQNKSPTVATTDSFTWTENTEGTFTVKSCYERFFRILSGPPLGEGIVSAAKSLWKVKAPPKILIFGWRVMHNRLATKDQLFKRGILVLNSDCKCVFCLLDEETLAHLFGGCTVISKVWLKVFDWIRPIDNLNLEEFVGFNGISVKVKDKTKKAIIFVIWLATAWCIWIRRNAIIFKKEKFSFIDCISEIILLSWS